jgi:hypothetical protein
MKKNSDQDIPSWIQILKKLKEEIRQESKMNGEEKLGKRTV